MNAEVDFEPDVEVLRLKEIIRQSLKEEDYRAITDMLKQFQQFQQVNQPPPELIISTSGTECRQEMKYTIR